MATHSSILAWRILKTEEPGGLQSMGLQRAGHDCETFTHTSKYMKRLLHELPIVAVTSCHKLSEHSF